MKFALDEPPRWFATRLSLVCGMAVPFAYFGSQAVAQLFVPGYDWHHQLASELGARGEPTAGLFNAGMLVTGAATLLAVPGFYGALRRAGASAGAWLAAACLVSSGGATLWAAAHPLPSPLHNPGYWGAGTLFFPAALACALPAGRPATAVRAYLLLSFAAAAALLLMIDLKLLAAAPAGLLQRIAAALVYPPVAVCAYVLLKRLRIDFQARPGSH